MSAVPPDAVCATHVRTATRICARCGSFACEACSDPHCVTKDDGSGDRASMLGAFSLMCALSTFCCVALRDGFWVGFPFQVLGVVMGAFSIRLAREKKIAVSEIAVLGVMLSALALIGDVVWALFFVFRVQK